MLFRSHERKEGEAAKRGGRTITGLSGLAVWGGMNRSGKGKRKACRCVRWGVGGNQGAPRSQHDLKEKRRSWKVSLGGSQRKSFVFKKKKKAKTESQKKTRVGSRGGSRKQQAESFFPTKANTRYATMWAIHCVFRRTGSSEKSSGVGGGNRGGGLIWGRTKQLAGYL